MQDRKRLGWKALFTSLLTNTIILAVVEHPDDEDFPEAFSLPFFVLGALLLSTLFGMHFAHSVKNLSANTDNQQDKIGRIFLLPVLLCSSEQALT